MTKRALLLGLVSLGLFSPAGTCNAQEPDKNRERVRTLQRQVMDLEAIGLQKMLQNRGVKPLPRPGVRASYNVERFPPVMARFVRFNVLATVNGAEPCLDTLEVYGPDGSTNLIQGARTTASSAHPTLGKFNGGIYGKGWCWASREPGKGWVQVELQAPAKIDRLVWSRDAENRYHDRVPSVYTIEVSEDGGAWQTVASGQDRAAPGNDFGVTRSTFVRALDPSQQKQRRELMDELRKLGAPGPNVVQSGPQVGDGINGKFIVHGLNASLGGRNYCPV
jgi:hypothetical protein